MRRGLGFTALSPSVDPYSLAFNAGSTALTLLTQLIGRGRREADQIVPEQNRLHHEVLAPTVDAKDNPATPTADLLYWRDVLLAEGAAFYQFTQQFHTAAGEQARRTIFGVEDAAGKAIWTTDAPGYATQILSDLQHKIYERTGMQEMDINWGKILQFGVQAAAALTGKPAVIGQPGGTIYQGQPPTQTYYPTQPSIPDWLLPAGLALGVGLLLFGGRGRR